MGKDSICWTCVHSFPRRDKGYGCPWFLSMDYIEGWDIEYCGMYDKYGELFLVKSCPMYKFDKGLYSKRSERLILQFAEIDETNFSPRISKKKAARLWDKHLARMESFDANIRHWEECRDRRMNNQLLKKQGSVMLICPCCEKPYDYKNNIDRDFCSVECRAEYKKIKNRGKYGYRVYRKKRKCRACGKEFVPTRSLVNYCSIDCMVGNDD